MAVTVVVIFFLCFSPLVILALLLTTGSIRRCNAETFRIVAKFFAQSNCAMNAFVYYVFNSQFRRGFISHLMAMFCCLRGNENGININVSYSTSSHRISLLSGKRTKRTSIMTDNTTV